MKIWNGWMSSDKRVEGEAGERTHIDADQVDLCVPVFTGLGGGHVDDLARTTLLMAHIVSVRQT